MFPGLLERKPTGLLIVAVFLAAGALIASGSPRAHEPQVPVSFEKDVLPVFTNHCTSCHNATSHPVGLDLTTEAATLRGSDGGPVIIPGSSQQSVLFQRISAHTMPPQGKGSFLNSDEAAVVRIWIDGFKATGRTTSAEIQTPSAEPKAPSAHPPADSSFDQQALPIFTKHCVACHNPKSPPQGLDLTTEATALRGSENGPVILPGKSPLSLLYQKVSGHFMPPPKRNDPLSNDEVEALRRWIDDLALNCKTAVVAALPAPVEPKAPVISDKDRDFWAFKSPVNRPIPHVKNAKLVRTPIDAFLLSKLEDRGLSFSPEASKLALMRRACFDLTGLPPSPEEIQAYLADSRPGAYERLIDRLLDSPRYGERWGRHWLDVAGYVDEKGDATDLGIIKLVDGMWRYRDYVIRAFNHDKPYDRFLMEQLAGDELVDWRHAPKYTPEILDDLIATGYMRNIMDLTDAVNVNHPPYYYDVLSRLVDSFSSGALGLTGGCARCHNHKYDPIPQADYYRLMAIFASGYNPEKWKQPKDRYLPDVSKADQDEFAKFNAEIDRPLNELKKQLGDLRGPHEQRLFQAKLVATVPEPLRADVKTSIETPKEKRNEIQKYLFKALGAQLKVSPQEVDKDLSAEDRATSADLQKKINTYESWRRKYGEIQALWDVGKQPEVHLLRRGNADTPGMLVNPGFFTVLSAPGKADAVPPPDTPAGSVGVRLALARWMTSTDNPLTARVFVNRVWMLHFGKGIVATPENFGRIGSPPTNPELLDWLAVDFMQNGWKIKRLQRMIMTSTAYRQTSRRPADNQPSIAEKVDPGNDLLWRMNLQRLDAEIIRDSILAVSGKLNLEMGGPPVMLDSDASGLVTVTKKGPTPTSEWRRSVYLMARRNYSVSFLDVFDFPVMGVNCTRRLNSATPLQSLTMMNSGFVVHQSDYFAERVKTLAGSNATIDDQVEKAFLLAFRRKPTAEQLKWSTDHIGKQRQLYLNLGTPPEESSEKALASLCQMLLAANEFIYVE